jgi:glyoxylase-like metal-dependent hydrolase (beta-lactamase superfamily II)
MRELQPGLWHWQAPHPEWESRAPYTEESRRALVAGDALSGLIDEDALQYKWLRRGVPRDQLVAPLQPLLELPVDVVLPAHGAPADRAALERALS